MSQGVKSSYHFCNTLVIIQLIFLQSFFSLKAQNTVLTPGANVRFCLNYNTIKPVDIRKAVFYFSILRNSSKKDSVIISYPFQNKTIDTIQLKSKWNFPHFVSLRLDCSDGIRVSNIFFFHPEVRLWNVNISDSKLSVSPADIHNFDHPSRSLIGLVLVLQTFFEMIIAFMMSQMVGWSRAIWVMVLTANIASFPLYLINFSFIWLRELIVLVIKTFVMTVIGYRKIKVYKIVIFAIILSIVSFGFKEILFVLIRIL